MSVFGVMSKGERNDKAGVFRQLSLKLIYHPGRPERFAADASSASNRSSTSADAEEFPPMACNISRRRTASPLWSRHTADR
jgi:hypothetical protein